MFKLRHVLLLISSMGLSGCVHHAAQYGFYPTNAPIEYGNVVVWCKKSVSFEPGKFTLNFDYMRDRTRYRQYPDSDYRPPPQARYSYPACPDSGVEEEVIRYDDLKSETNWEYVKTDKDHLRWEQNFRAGHPTPYAHTLGDSRKLANPDPTIAATKVWEVSRVDMDGAALMGTGIINHFMAVVVEGNLPPLGYSFNGISRHLVSDISAGPGDVTQTNGLEWHHYAVTAKGYGRDFCDYQDKTACDNIIRSDLYGTKIGNYTLFILGSYGFAGWYNLPALESRRQLLRKWVDSFSVVKPAASAAKPTIVERKQ